MSPTASLLTQTQTFSRSSACAHHTMAFSVQTVFSLSDAKVTTSTFSFWKKKKQHCANY